MVATAKRFIPKQALAAFSPDAAYSFPGKSLSALHSWLGIRYNRAAFPDPFVDRLSQSKVDKRLAKIIEPVGDLLSAVYFNVDGGKEIDHSDGSPYELKIVLAYPPGDNPEQAADEVEKLEADIEDLFSKKHFDQATGKWNGVALKQCMSISEDDLRVSRAKMETKTCNACGCTFTPRPQNPNQKYCTNSEYQRERRRRWQQQARPGDSDYRGNDIRSSKTWAAKNPEYWKRYRDENPAYVERNRNLQQQRNQKKRPTAIANEDVSHALINPPSGRYRMAQILEEGAIGGQTWIVEITTLTMARVDEDV